MRWRKLGCVFAPDGTQEWARSHAMVPTAHLINDDTIRIFYSTLDAGMVGSISAMDVSAHNPLEIAGLGDGPLLMAGDKGLFDDSGVNPSCLLQSPDGPQLYYFGWQRSEMVPYHIFAGVAQIHGLDGDLSALSLERLTWVPVLDRIASEPFVRSATTIEKIGDEYVCFYVSAHEWTEVNGSPLPSYTIKRIVSQDGLTWPGQGDDVVGFGGAEEFGFGRPWLFKNGDTYELYYSIRSRARPYRIGYATSADGQNWTRRDDIEGLDRSPEGWDSEMICFPSVVNAGGQTYMFYNGNQHGRTGFGVAVRET